MVDDYDIPPPPGSAAGDPRSRSKPWLMVYFECCHSYGRMNRNREGTHYSGCCPKCGGRVSARIGEEGTGRRMFRAG